MEPDFFLRHRYPLLFSVVLAEQLGLPVPATPVLLGAGALVGMGQMEALPAIALAVLACQASDLIWFELGRRRGASILGFLCRMSLEPESCVRTTEDTFARRGSRTLLVAKFFPGLGTVAAPLAGIIGMSRARFLAWTTAGALLWTGAWMLVGFVFRHQLDQLVRALGDLGGRFGSTIALAFLLWLLYKFVQRRRFLHGLRVARIEPLELKQRMDAGEDVYVVDLRGALDFERDPAVIPGALRLRGDELEARHHEIPRGREIVLYCT
jgi:membrane protein DedA with SNARE-associated domain